MYNEYTHYTETLAGDVTARARAFGMHTESIDGQDVQLVQETMEKLVERARRGEGPSFLECKTYRYYGHHVGDINRTYYRSKEEEQEWRSERDPLQLLAGKLLSENLTDQQVLDQITAQVQSEVDGGVDFAIQAPYPAAEEVDQDVYA
jgi:pyruvate dehydrogenase E1 component alpha subunit